MDFFSEFADLFDGSLYPSNNHVQGSNSTSDPVLEGNSGVAAFNQPPNHGVQAMAPYEAPTQTVAPQQAGVSSFFYEGWNYQGDSFVDHGNSGWQEAVPIQQLVDFPTNADNNGQQEVDILEAYGLHMPSEEPAVNSEQQNTSTAAFSDHGMQQWPSYGSSTTAHPSLDASTPGDNLMDQEVDFLESFGLYMPSQEQAAADDLGNASSMPLNTHGIQETEANIPANTFVGNIPSAQPSVSSDRSGIQATGGQMFDVQVPSTDYDWSRNIEYAIAYNSGRNSSTEVTPPDGEMPSTAEDTKPYPSPEEVVDLTVEDNDTTGEDDPTPDDVAASFSMTCKTSILTKTDVLIRQLERSFSHPRRHRSQKLETALLRRSFLDYYLFREDDRTSGPGKSNNGRGLSLNHDAKHPRAKDFLPRDLEENQCYCNDQRDFSEAELMCKECFTWFHRRCLREAKREPIVPFMLNYEFTCGLCAREETFILRKAMKYELLAVTAIANLRHQSVARGEHREFFSRANEVLPWIESCWVEITGETTRRSASKQHTIFRKLIRTPGIFRVLPEDQKERVRSVSREFPKYALRVLDPRAIRPICDRAIKTADCAAHLNNAMRDIEELGLPLPPMYRIPENQRRIAENLPLAATQTFSRTITPAEIMRGLEQQSSTLGQASQPPPNPSGFMYQQRRPLSRLLVHPGVETLVRPTINVPAPFVRPPRQFFTNPYE